MLNPPPDRRAWLRQAAVTAGWRRRVAAALLLLDALGAILFAAGLAGALTSLAGGLARLAPWLALTLGAATLRGLLAWTGAQVGAAAAARARTALRRRAIVACLGQPAGNRLPVGQMMAIAIDAVETMDGYIARFLPARAAAAAPLIILAATAWASPISAAIEVATLIPFITLMVLAGGAASDASRRQFTALSRLSGLFADRLRALPTILAFQAEPAETDRLGAAADALRRRTMAVLRVAFISAAGLEFFAAVSVALVAVYAGFTLLGVLPFPAPERLTLFQAIFVLALAPEFYAPMRRLAAAYHDRQAAETAADQLMALDRTTAAPTPGPSFVAAPRIEFDHVSVRYPNEDAPALAELSFAAAPGEIVVLLGPSGAGKTSALNLLLGLAPLAAGEVWINRHALSQLGAVAGAAGWMGQSPLIMPGSIADNIALSRQDAPADDIEAAAERAGLTPLLLARGGLSALVDERGGGLSGGERGRIALARALLKQAPILLLDEPTAHLDAAAESAMIAAIRQAAVGRTTIIATHSQALARIADHIVRVGPQ